MLSWTLKKSHPTKAFYGMCNIRTVLSLPGHRGDVCVGSIQIRDAHTTRVLHGNTAYCNIHLVTHLYNKQRRNSIDDRIFGCGADVETSNKSVLTGNHFPGWSQRLTLVFAVLPWQRCFMLMVHHNDFPWQFALHGILPQEVLILLCTPWHPHTALHGDLTMGSAHVVRA